MSDFALTHTLRRDSVVVAAALAVITALAWAYVLRLAADMDMDDMDMTPAEMALMMQPAYTPWALADFGFMFAMWAVMMIGMMTPTAAPMVLLYTRVAAKAAQSGKPFAAAGWFLGGYLLAWTLFSFAATVAQWGFERLLILDPMMMSASKSFNGVVLIVVGIYQWTPLKRACLKQCQAPLSFVQRYGGFRPQASASLRLGWRHGLYCTGCCWALMALLFIGGVMNLLWIAMIMIVVLAEKLIPGRWLPRLTGTAFIAVGAWMLATQLGG